MKYYKNEFRVFKVNENTKEYWYYNEWFGSWEKGFYCWDNTKPDDRIIEITEQEAFVEILCQPNPVPANLKCVIINILNPNFKITYTS